MGIGYEKAFSTSGYTYNHPSLFHDELNVLFQTYSALFPPLLCPLASCGLSDVIIGPEGNILAIGTYLYCLSLFLVEANPREW